MTTKALWQDYLFLTREIEKFLLQQNFDMVNELLKQRENLQETIDNTPSEHYLASSEGQTLFDEVNAKNRGMEQIVHMLRNKSQQNHAVANAYDRLGMNSAGYRMDSKS